MSGADGFAMVIFSAALRGVPQDTIEAALIDGANRSDVLQSEVATDIFHGSGGLDNIGHFGVEGL